MEGIFLLSGFGALRLLDMIVLTIWEMMCLLGRTDSALLELSPSHLGGLLAIEC